MQARTADLLILHQEGNDRDGGQLIAVLMLDPCLDLDRSAV